MCGVAGVFNMRGGPLPKGLDPEAVLGTIRHRGPDDTGCFLGDSVFLGAVRLAVIDPQHGRQPVSDESGRLHLVMNGEIYDHDRLRKELEAKGHCFVSRCDTEVALHLFEDDWSGALETIDGQFAIAAYDARERKLLLARDRMGISPLFYAVVGDLIVFASEMKAIFATGLVRPELDPRALDAILAFGTVPAPRAVFKGIRSLPPGRLLEVKGGCIREATYWDIPYPDAGDYSRRSEAEWADELRSLFQSACRRRVKADVPVGIFLSGGIDSGSVAAMVADTDGIRERAFSISFPEPGFDESAAIKSVADFLGLRTHLLSYTQQDLARDLPRLVYHAETPLISTESVPLMALSGLASRHVKVVLTGEGSDEALGGYQYFRWEDFAQRCRQGLVGKALLGAARWQLGRLIGRANPFFPSHEDEAWADEVFGFYPAGMLAMFYWRKLRELVYSPEMLERQRGLSDAELVDLPRAALRRWDPLNRSLYVSSRLFMSAHLLGAHGDRALMANSVEGRYPFLDRAVQEFLTTVPPELKTCWHTEKQLLRHAMRGRLPLETLRRRKKAFLAPFGTPFVGDDAPEYARDLLSSRTLRESGYFDPAKVLAIIGKLEGAKRRLATDRGEGLRVDRETVERTLYGMACTFVISTQVLEDMVRRGDFNDAEAVGGNGASVLRGGVAVAGRVVASAAGGNESRIGRDGKQTRLSPVLLRGTEWRQPGS
jgi:asparagine synthase (glutamine-hydrolysing)